MLKESKFYKKKSFSIIPVDVTFLKKNVTSTGMMEKDLRRQWMQVALYIILSQTGKPPNSVNVIPEPYPPQYKSPFYTFILM